MSSFFGGRPGTGFTFKKSFNTKTDMITAFSQGGNYKDVQFGEYVIINSGSEKGKVYRRTSDLGNGMGGAEYIFKLAIELDSNDYLYQYTIGDTIYIPEWCGFGYYYIPYESETYWVTCNIIIPGLDNINLNDNNINLDFGSNYTPKIKEFYGCSLQSAKYYVEDETSHDYVQHYLGDDYQAYIKTNSGQNIKDIESEYPYSDNPYWILFNHGEDSTTPLKGIEITFDTLCPIPEEDKFTVINDYNNKYPFYVVLQNLEIEISSNE